MGIQSIPAPSSSSAPFPTAGAVVAQTHTTSGFYSTSLAAGKYVITVEGTSVNQGYPSYSPIHVPAGYSITSYLNNIYHMNAPYGSPSVISLSTTDTVFITAAAATVRPWVYSFDSMNTRGYHSYQRWSSANSDIDKFFFVGSNDSSAFHVARVIWAPPTTPATVTGQNETKVNIWNPSVNQTSNASNLQAYVGNAWFIARGNFENASSRTVELRRSTDFVTWTALTIGTEAGTPIEDILYSGTLYVSCSRGTTAASNIATSTDGISWTARNSGTTAGLTGLAFGNNTYVAVGLSGTISSSTDGITWVARTAPTTSTNYYRVLFQNNLFLALGDSNGASYTALAVSTNGTTWTAASGFANKAAADAYTAIPGAAKNYALGVGGYMKGQVFAAGGYFYVLYGSNVWTSTNGTTWTVRYIGEGAGTQLSLVGGYSSTWGRVIGWNHDGAQSGGPVDIGTVANYSIYASTV